MKRCWEPVPGFIPEYPYSCGNKPCYKIFDPADDVEAAVGYSTNLTVLGVLFLLTDVCALAHFLLIFLLIEVTDRHSNLGPTDLQIG